MSWVLLLVAGVVEISFVMSLGHPGSFRSLWPTVAVFVTGLFSLYLLALAMTGLPVGTAYAVWSGIGAGGGEPTNLLRIAGLAAVIGGVVLLRLAGD